MFRIKLHSDRTIDRYKACFVSQGFTVVPETDYSHTFSPIVFSSSTIIIVVSLATIYLCLLHQLDVKNAFLSGNRNELVYMEQAPDFIAPARPNRVCKLKKKSLYGLKQAPCAWFKRLSDFLFKHGFTNSMSDPSLFWLSQRTYTTIFPGLY